MSSEDEEGHHTVRNHVAGISFAAAAPIGHRQESRPVPSCKCIGRFSECDQIIGWKVLGQKEMGGIAGKAVKLPAADNFACQSS